MLTAYQRFERIVAFILSVLIAMIVAVALWGLVVDIVQLLRQGALDHLDHSTFQAVFGTIMTVLIAMEFNHTVLQATLTRDHVIEVKTVVLIAILAITRKFIVLEPDQTSAQIVAALALAVLVLGVTFWLIAKAEREEGRNRADRGPVAPGAPAAERRHGRRNQHHLV